jgi:hypothetical protein
LLVARRSWSDGADRAGQAADAAAAGPLAAEPEGSGEAGGTAAAISGGSDRVSTSRQVFKRISKASRRSIDDAFADPGALHGSPADEVAPARAGRPGSTL